MRQPVTRWTDDGRIEWVPPDTEGLAEVEREAHERAASAEYRQRAEIVLAGCAAEDALAAGD